ncbi:MAG: DNA-processing protein DprA [Prevotellaceae bacterium]|nr:DNA-processing protein DprA [Prevotellaceae bacterium]
MNTDLTYQLALTLIPGVGSITAKQLIAYCGNAETVLTSPAKALLRIPDVGTALCSAIDASKHAALNRAKQELEFMAKNGVQAFSFLDKRYPERLRNCEDSPLILYAKGSTDLNAPKVISIVGTRNATAYGRQQCENLVRDLAGQYAPLVVSGLAFGVDVCAHRAALAHGLPTVAVMGHGLDMVYPAQHLNVAREMLQQGGALLSDFTSKCRMDPSNFVKRNRIVAGMADATIVVESAEKGGALITADMAFGYSRDVMAFPGRVGDKASAGCLKLIKANKAALIENAADVAYLLSWDVPRKQPVQQSLFLPELPDDEKTLLNFLSTTEAQSIDIICRSTGLAMPKVSSALLNLEFSGLVKALPGKTFLKT